MSVNVNDTNRIKEMREKTYAPSTSNQTASSNNNDERSTKVRPHIGVCIPQPFEPVEEVTMEKASKITKMINSLMSEIFVDFKESHVQYNPQVGGIGCTLRFIYMNPEDIANDDRITALSTISKETHATNEWAEDIKKINATINNKSNTSNAIITKAGKEYLEDIVIKGYDGKVNWNSNVVIYNEHTVPDMNGRNSVIITMDVSVNLVTILHMMYNGTPGDCEDFKINKKFTYTPYYHTTINGNDFLMRIVKTDSKKQKQIAEDNGIYRIMPSTWNIPTPTTGGCY